ncbi:hypothetical protein ACE6H2_024924 [Prunus campanulata]
MEANICDVNHLDADVLLPPRKRLLAGLKKQSPDGDGSSWLSLVASSASASASASASSSSSPSSSEFNTRLNNILSSHNPNLSPEELVEISNLAAAAAAKAAEDARAAAEEKAGIAAKAVAAAKSALELVASFSEDVVGCKEKYLKKNKLKKHVPVQLLYKKYQPIENCKKDEELARKLHRAINSSPRISKNSSSTDSKGHKHKKPKIVHSSEKVRVSNGGIELEQNPEPACNGHAVAGKVNVEGTILELYKNKAEEKAYRHDKAGRLEMDNGEAESSQMKEKSWDDMCTSGKKRGRVKLKKLPLSICTFRDQANPKEEMDARGSPLTVVNRGNPTAGKKPLFPVESSADSMLPIEATPVWKYQDFKAPACVKQNKVMQS